MEKLWDIEDRINTFINMEFTEDKYEDHKQDLYMVLLGELKNFEEDLEESQRVICSLFL